MYNLIIMDKYVLYGYTVFMASASPAEKLRTAIKEYEKNSGKKIYDELPEAYRSIREQTFYKQIQRMSDVKLLSNTNILYQVLKIIGMSFSSLFEADNPETQFAFYLNKINENLSAIRKRQEENDWLAKNSAVKNIRSRNTQIKKLDMLMSIIYLLDIINLKFWGQTSVFENNFIVILNPQSEYYAILRRLQLSQPNDIFIYFYHKYEPKNQKQLARLFAMLSQTAINNPLVKENLSLLGLSHIILVLTYNYIASFPTNPFAENNGGEIFELQKKKFRDTIKSFNATFEFIFLRNKVNVLSNKKEKKSEAIIQLRDTVRFIEGLLSVHILPYWKSYKETIENGFLSFSQSAQTYIAQNQSILEFIRKINSLEIKTPYDEQYLVCEFRQFICRTFSGGLQLPTPKFVRDYEKMVSNSLKETKLPVQNKNYCIEFWEKTAGFLERTKQMYQEIS